MNRFSIVIPAFNVENSIQRAFNSVIRQDYLDFELIVVNDGSTDGTHAILSELEKANSFILINQQNQGVSAARNSGATQAKSDWLIFLDSDDELIPSALAQFNKAIESDSKRDFWQAGIRRISGQNLQELIPIQDEYHSKIPGTFCISKGLFEQVGGYDEQMKFSENTELFHRVGLKGVIGGVISEITLIYYDSSTGGSKNLQNMIDSLLIILDKHETTLSDHVKYLYHQIIGVNYMRFRNYSLARKHLLKAISYKPLKAKTLIRLFISMVPPLAKKLYPQEVKL
ncbi:glycosyltransferase family 2 protein [Algoriphagus ratkowskyi]|uniref:glycosyltransferase family 2 protein n=1 Tax=Algoriphagus ratkowskyi TaxID=57028 RepID=UPI001302821A|nr:glycosyltransferase family A protein [Algoriphagus ratkowskyi]